MELQTYAHTHILNWIDDKFRDRKDNLWLHHSSKPLEDTILRYSKDQNNKKMKIATS